MSKLGPWMDERSRHSQTVEIEGAEHSGEQTWTMDVTKEAATHNLWRSKVQNTAVSKLGPWM